MKTLFALMFVMLTAVSVSSAERPQVSQCFKVNALLKQDAIHYWADWTNACHYTIDSVYVMVGFSNRSEKRLEDGVWPMYFVRPGDHRVTRFTIPAGAAGFESVRVRKITTDSDEALR